jgi:SulP family sulfate permease
MPGWLQAKDWHLFVPKLFVALREGYGLSDLKADLFAGLTVAIVALPLSMALAIASGTAPERGLFTAVVAGFLISALGGSRHQIGGPTGAFVVVVFNVVQRFGYDGLVIATVMAGAMLILAGLLRAGTFIKYVPHPVVTGFTSGIAVVIFSSQVGDILGLSLSNVPGDVPGKWLAYFANLSSFNPYAVAVAVGSLAAILVLKRLWPRAPFLLLAVTAASLLAAFLALPVETIGTRFGGIPRSLPAPHLPVFTWNRMVELFPSAFTIFVLGGIESLLSAVVADGMTGRRHRSNCELVAQGIANIASAGMGGIPATGAIARTATSIRAGARTPIAGMSHAVFVLLIMALFAPLASYIPLAALGAVLTIVAWNMAEVRNFTHLLSAPAGDRAVLLITFLLTVFIDLAVAIQVGMVVAAFVFMHRMANVVELETHTELIKRDVDDFTEPRPDIIERSTLPPGVEVFRLDGPFFFGAAARFEEVLARFGKRPRVLILRMSRVPLIDATGVAALRKFIESSRSHGTSVVLSGVRPAVGRILDRMHLEAVRAENFPAALDLARGIMAAKVEH